jgi:hypothetical protein
MVTELAEAFAVKHAVTLARNEGLDRIIVLSDCLSLVQRINSSSQDRSLVGVMVKDIKEITSPMSLVAFHHISRLCNNSAHLVSRIAVW